MLAFLLLQSFITTVTPLPNETFAGPCRYELTLPAGNHRVKGVWVTFDRGRDIAKFYSDPEVAAFARKHDLALMLPHQCVAKDAPGGPGEMDMDPSHGVARALFTALSQFASQTGHPELAAAKLILLGFSGTGALFAQFVAYQPNRVLAAILANPGHYDPVGVDNVHLPVAALKIPELIITGGADRVAGTQRPYNYFRQYYDRGAPWTFLVQNQTPHCCVINTKDFMLAWLQQALHLKKTFAWEGFVRVCPTPVRDTWGAPAWNVCDAVIEPARSTAPSGMISAGWLPTHALAGRWLSFIKQPNHPVTSLP